MPTMLDSLCALTLWLAAATPAAAQSIAADGATSGRPTSPEIAQAAPAGSAETEPILGAGSWRESVGLDRVDGVLVGAGPNYKAEFNAAGIHYTTALGFAAPQAGTLSFELDSIRRGDLPLATGEPSAQPDHAGLMVTFERGPAIREQYIVQSDGLEQQFVFDSLPAGAGDLVVRGRVTTSLVARGLDGSPGVGVFRDGLRFESPGYGSFVYGGVTGVDARGNRVAGELHFDGQWLELSLPEHFVSTAALPLTLDPLLGGNTTVHSDTYLLSSDIAFDVTNNVYLVVWQKLFAVNNSDVFGQRVSPSGALVGGLVLVEPFANSQGTDPTVANNNGSDRFLVAWEQFPSVLGGFQDLACRAVNASNGAVSNVLLFDINGFAPDAGGEVLEGFANVQVVFAHEGVRGASISVPPTGTPGLAATYVVTSENALPAISKSGGGPGRYLVVWEGEDGTGMPEIRARAVSYLGVPESAIADLTNSPQVAERLPEVDGNGVDFIVAYDRDDFSGPVVHDMHCKRVQWSAGSLSFDSSGTLIPTGPGGDLQYHLPAVAMVGGTFLAGGSSTKCAIAWTEQKSATEYVALYREINPANCLACGLTKTLGSGALTINRPVALASEVNSGGSGATDGGMASFTRSPTSVGGPTAIVVQPFEALGAGGTVVDQGGGCAGGGTASTFGPLAIGNKAFEYRLTGAAPTATVAIHNMSFAPTYLPCGSCNGILPGILHVRPLVGGAASFPSAVPCNASALGIVFDSDWIVLPVPTVPCPAFPNFANSNVLRLTVGE